MKMRIKLEGSSYDVEVELLPAGEAPEAAPEPEAIDCLELPPPPPDIRPEDRICHSPIAGLVISVAVQMGQFVRKDEPIATLEAMKMQVPIGAPVDGVVEEVNVNAGEAVLPGQVLCRLG